MSQASGVESDDCSGIKIDELDEVAKRTGRSSSDGYVSPAFIPTLLSFELLVFDVALSLTGAPSSD